MKKRSAPRDYDQEYRDHQSSPEDIAARSKRNKDRAEKEKSLGHKLGPKQDVHHPGGDLSGPTVVISESENTGMPEKSRLKDSARRSAVVKELRSRKA